jgi:hypothetical protein
MCRGLRGQLRLLGLSLFLFAAQQIVFPGDVSATRLEPPQCEDLCTQSANESCETECAIGWSQTTCYDYVMVYGDGSPAHCCEPLGCGVSCEIYYSYTPISTFDEDYYDGSTLVGCGRWTTYHVDRDSCGLADRCEQFIDYYVPNPPYPGYCCEQYGCGGTGPSCDI